ncbi:MAG: NUDIX hydrolase, partial [Clostridia bacterium]|nr:NUDIX hydrolase [Clostridia bacterium]
GKLEYGEDPDEAAARELSEETGLTADSIKKIGSLYTTPAMIDEVIHLYLATGLHEGAQHLDDDEFINVEKRPLADAVAGVLNGEIPDAKTQVILLRAEKLIGR